MITIYKHGIKHSKVKVCPYCGCTFGYTSDDVNADDRIKCPECKEYLSSTSSNDVPKYVRNLDKEKTAIDECLNTMDFEELAAACYTLSQNMPETFDYLADYTAEKLRDKCRQELEYCFEQMAQYGYVINYKGGNSAISYCMDGHFSVNTYYDLAENIWWCNSDFVISEGGKY